MIFRLQQLLFYQIMNNQSRYLPHLNLCYLQKKAYEVHLQKVAHIKNTLRSPNKVDNLSKNKKKFVSQTKYKMTTIPEKVEKVEIKLSPYYKKIRQQAIRENMRLFNAIQKCPSTINHKNMSRQSLQSDKHKDRLSKFTILPGSNKTFLKCQISLEKLSKKNNKAFNSSRVLQSDKGSRVKKYENIQKQSSYETVNSSFNWQSQQRTQNLIFNRNQNRVNKHFQRSEIAIRTKQKLLGFKQHLQNSKKLYANPIYKWKSRCFTTQADSHRQQPI